MDIAWEEIARTYRLHYSSGCFFELKREVMGENTSVDEFIRNINSKGLEPSLALVIQNILEKNRTLLNRDPEILWSDEYTENAAKEMAAILVDAVKSVLEKDDQLKILKAIADSEERIKKTIEEAEGRLKKEIQRIEYETRRIKHLFGELVKDRYYVKRKDYIDGIEPFSNMHGLSY